MQSTKRLVWKTPRAGALASLRLEEEALLPLEPGKMRVATKAVGLNFADIFALTGLYSATPSGSFIPGLEFSGVVQDAGNSSIFKQGDRVMCVTRFGGYASVIDIDPRYCARIPDQWSFPQGAAYLAQTLTAWYALKTLADIKPRQLVLVQSAAGGVGLQALRICAKLGAETIGVVGNDAKKTFLGERGFRDVIVRGRGFRGELRSMLRGRELHLVLDAVGGKIQKECFEALAPTGRLVVYGAAEFTPGRNRPRYFRAALQYLRRPRYDPLDMISANKSVMAFNLIWLWSRVDLFAPMMQALDSLGLEPPYVGREYPFSEAPAAIQYLRAGQSVGKVVLAV